MLQDLQFLFSSFMTYTAGNPIWILYFAALLYLLIRGGKDARMLFIWPLAILGLTVFNPLVCGLLIDRYGFEERYLRFFWMLNHYITIAYAVALLVSRMHKKSSAAAAVVISAALIVILGNPVFFGEDVPPYRKTPNASFIRDDYPGISDLIHEDGEEMPMILCSGDLMMTYRMYDPNVRIQMSRSVYYYLASFNGVEDFLENGEAGPLLTILYQVYYFDDFSVPVKHFLYACHKREVRYIVCKSDAYLNNYLATNEYFLKKGESGTYSVWKVLLPGEV